MRFASSCARGTIGRVALPKLVSPSQMARRLALEDFIFFPYVLAVVWQFFSFVPNLIIAWLIAAVISLGVWYAYLLLKSPDQAKRSKWFWMIVVFPLAVIYTARALYPDISFDVLNYHIFHAERTLHGPLLWSTDFFPTPAPFNPAPDVLTGLYRHLLGYRLGTIANLFAVGWLGIVLDRILRGYLQRSWLRSVSVLVILCTEQVVFEINNYMVDLLALPLLLEATRLTLRKTETKELSRDGVLVALLLGISVSFKLANLVFAVPIALLFAFRVIATFRSKLFAIARLTTATAIIFLLPLLPFSIFMYRLTGNPFFPLYNAVFRSPYWPITNILDPRWGPRNLQQTLGWPILVFLKPERFCEFPVYSGRMSLGIIAAIVCLFLAKGEWLIRGTSFVTLISALLWSAASGYSRYAIFLEITSGILIVWLIVRLSSQFAFKSLRVIPQAALALLLLAQVGLALNYANDYEWSMRGTVFVHRLRYTLREAGQLLRDRDLSGYLSPDDRHSIDDVEAWIETAYKTTALMALLKPRAPIIGARTQEYFMNQAGRERFDEAVAAEKGKRLFTLTDAANLSSAREVLSRRGLATGSMRPISIPFFSESTRFEMLLIEVIPAESETESSPDGAPAKGVALPDKAFQAQIQVSDPPLTMHAGEKYVLNVTLRNASRIAWPGQQTSWQYQITVGNRWLKPDGTKVTDVDGRTSLSNELAPGNSAMLRLSVTAPATGGDYVLELDAIQEGVAWFSDHGSPTFKVNIRVN